MEVITNTILNSHFIMHTDFYTVKWDSRNASYVLSLLPHMMQSFWFSICFFPLRTTLAHFAFDILFLLNTVLHNTQFLKKKKTTNVRYHFLFYAMGRMRPSKILCWNPNHSLWHSSEKWNFWGVIRSWG